MRQVSTELKNLIDAEKLPDINITLTLPQEGGGISLSPTIKSDSVVWKQGNSEGGAFTIGGCNISTFFFSCFNTEWKDYDWTDSYFDVSFTYTDGTNNYTLDIGRFWVGIHENSIGGIDVTGYDALIFLDNQTISQDDISGNLDALAAVQAAIADTPVVLSQEATDYLTGLGTYKFVRKERVQETTKRFFLSQVLQAFCGFAFMRHNELVVREITPTVYKNPNTVLMDDLPMFSERHNAIMINGFHFTATSLDASYVDDIGDKSGYIINIDNPHCFLDKTTIQYESSFESFVGAYVHAGELSVITNPLYEPGDLFYYTDWKYSVIATDGFFANQLTWRGKNVRMSIVCDAEMSPYNDMRSVKKESETPESDIFETGTVTLKQSWSTATFGSAVIQLDNVPSKYRRSYICIATPQTEGTIQRVSTGLSSCLITGTIDMVVAYQLCKNTSSASSSSTASLMADYGALGAAHISQIEEEYTQ